MWGYRPGNGGSWKVSPLSHSQVAAELRLRVQTQASCCCPTFVPFPFCWTNRRTNVLTVLQYTSALSHINLATGNKILQKLIWRDPPRTVFSWELCTDGRLGAERKYLDSTGDSHALVPQPRCTVTPFCVGTPAPVTLHTVQCRTNPHKSTTYWKP